MTDCQVSQTRSRSGLDLVWKIPVAAIAVVAMLIGVGYLTGPCRPEDIFSKSLPRHEKIFGAIASYRTEHGGRMPDSLNDLVQAKLIRVDDLSYRGKKGRVHIRYMRPFSFTPDYAVLLYDEVPEGVREAFVTDLRGRQGTAGPGLGLFELLEVHVPRHGAIWRAMSEFAAKHGGRFPDSWEELARAGFLPHAATTPSGSHRVVEIDCVPPPRNQGALTVVLRDRNPTEVEYPGSGKDLPQLVITVVSGETAVVDPKVLDRQ